MGLVPWFMLISSIFLCVVAKRIGNNSDFEHYVYTREEDRVVHTIGDCITFTSRKYYKYDQPLIFTWTKDLLRLKSSSNLRVKIKLNGNGDESTSSLSISALTPDDDAYYQVKVEDSVTGESETTRFWLTVKGCTSHQKPLNHDIDSCERNCEDMCDEGWTYVEGTKTRCYKYFDKLMTWSDANTRCQELGAQLATIESTAANEKVGDMLLTGNGGWIGLNDRNSETNYVWNYQKNYKEQLKFKSWGEKEPSNYNQGCNIENCVLIRGRNSNGKWLDLICDDFKPFVCEINATNKTGWTCTSSKCYRYFETPRQWLDAKSRCETFASGKLATIRSASENNMVQSLVVEQLAWIGLNDIWEAGRYVWNDNKGVNDRASYLNWDIGEPNDKYTTSAAIQCFGEDCVQIIKYKSKVSWQDVGCNSKLPFICEVIRQRAFSTGQIVGMVIGSLIFVSMASAIIYAGIKKQKRTQIKDIIKQAYEDDLTVREEKKKLISGASKPRVVVT